MYKFKLAKAHIIWGILLVFTIVFCVQYLKKLKNRKIVNTMKSRIILSVIYLVIIIALFRFDYSVLGLNSFDGWNAGGYIIYFLDSANLQKIKKPECYEREKYKEISKVTVENIQKKTMPNIIVIMNESFCDIERITDIDTNKDVLPFFHEFVQRDNIIEGNVYVSVYAGNTANTEMEFLTASTLGFWGKENLCYSIGYSGHLDILPRWMNELGYTTYGIHPARGENYMRKDIYEKMEFKNKLFIEDFIEKNVKVIQYPNASYFLKNIVNDSDNYQFLTDIAKEKEEPIFIFNTTIQNHGGYQWRELADVKIQNENLDNDFQKDINEYLTLLNQSDAALKELISEIETWEEDTIVLFFGDHQPLITINLDQELDLDLSAKDFYNVPFFIWANYEIETKHNVNTSANYLQNILLEASGIGLLNEYQEYVSDVQKEYPILTPIYTEDKNGNQVDFDELLQQENNLIKEYYSQSYKIIYDADN
ncbi:MAG: LTA synthase family protein [Eubacterium sp.]